MGHPVGVGAPGTGVARKVAPAWFLGFPTDERHINLGFDSDSTPRLGRTAARIGWSTHPVKTPGGPPKRDTHENFRGKEENFSASDRGSLKFKSSTCGTSVVHKTGTYTPQLGHAN